MSDRRIMLPMFLDTPSAAAQSLIRTGDVVVDAPLAAGDTIVAVAPLHRALADAVAGAVGSNQRPVAIMGDCCQTIPMMAGLARGGVHPTLLWLDSHGDFNTWETTPSGFLGGMPLAMLTGRGDQRMMQAVGCAPIADERVILSDARDLDPGERELVAASRMSHITDVADIAGRLPSGPLYVHFDTDIINASEAPAFRYPVRGGPSAEAMRAALAAIAATGRVVAISATVGWDTEADRDQRTARAVAHAMSGLFEI
jgi:arginase